MSEQVLGTPRLLRSQDGDLVPVYGTRMPPIWVQRAYKCFHEMVCDKDPTFPCYFGTAAELAGNMRYTFVEEEELDRPTVLVGSLIDYLRMQRTIPGRSALIVFLAQELDRISLAAQESQFWQIVQFLHDQDPLPWPENAPIDPDELGWDFHFGGEAIFVNGHAPSYRLRRSRGSKDGPFIVIQSLANLSGIAGSGPVAEAVRKKITALLSEYDKVPRAPDLTEYDPSGKRALEAREWKQFWLPDDDEQKSSHCPLRLSENATKKLG